MPQCNFRAISEQLRPGGFMPQIRPSSLTAVVKMMVPKPKVWAAPPWPKS